MSTLMSRRAAINTMALGAFTLPALARHGSAEGIYPAGKTVRIIGELRIVWNRQQRAPRSAELTPKALRAPDWIC